MGLPAAAAPKMNPRAGQLARKLQMAPMDPASDPSHLKALEGRVISILEDLDASARGNGPPPKDLLKQAYALRTDIGREYAEMAVDALAAAAEQARSLELFGGDGRYHGTIMKGPNKGEPAVFQYIAPVKYLPEFSRSLCNIEIVEPRKQRRSDEVADMDIRVISYGKRLRSLSTRMKRAPKAVDRKPAPRAIDRKPPPRERDYSMLRTKAEHDARWEELRKLDPQSGERPPSIVARFERKSTPSKASGGKYIYTVVIQNRSDFPTEITFEYAFIGGSSRDGYRALRRQSKTFKLLPTSTHRFEDAFSAGKVGYRGYAAVVHFNGKAITSFASDARMRNFTKPGALGALD
ncbi:MAG: hypothetical protein HKN82_19300 [Akkermansiaceae bacterium]|nr:hypothetical protein [Akkermansiaceae bacterium]NNM29337.1 hypothetical protein [Akkermansiaceae bacterium]